MKSFMKGIHSLIKNENGAVIIIVAFLLFFVLIGMVAISVDVGYLYLQRRHQQTTADAAALAAAWHLPWDGSNDSIIVSTAQAYILENNMNVTGVVTAPNGDSDKVKVEITENYNLFFAQAPPIGQSDADVYAMAVATKEYTFIDILPFLMLKYENIIDYEYWDDLPEEDKNKDTFYNIMKALVPIDEADFFEKTSSGQWGNTDMTAFSHYDSNNLQQVTYHILKYGLDEPFCAGERPGDRLGKTGVKGTYNNNVPASVDGFTIAQRLERDTDFFVPLVLPRIGESWTGMSLSEFGLDDFIIGHFRPLKVTGTGQHLTLYGTLIDVYKDCSQIDDEYKKWFPVLIE